MASSDVGSNFSALMAWNEGVLEGPSEYSSCNWPTKLSIVPSVETVPTLYAELIGYPILLCICTMGNILYEYYCSFQDVKAAPAIHGFAVFAKWMGQDDDVPVIWHRYNGCLTAIVQQKLLPVIGLQCIVDEYQAKRCFHMLNKVFELITRFYSQLCGESSFDNLKKTFHLFQHCVRQIRQYVLDQSVPVAFDEASFLAQMDFSGYILSRTTVPAKLLNRSLRNTYGTLYRGKDNLCISETYAGQCEDDEDPACSQSCKDESRGGGKCGPYKSTKVCYCDGCPGATEPVPTPLPIPLPLKTSDEFLAFTINENVWRIPLANELAGTRLLSNISADSGSIVADCVEHNLYWNSMSTGIRRSQYDGSDNKLVLPQPGTYLGLAIDFISRNIFWRNGDSLFVAKLKDLPAGQFTVMTDVRLTLDSALAVHPARGMIYWSASTGENGRLTIQATSMDGSNDKVLVEGVWVLSLAIDFDTDRLYWADHSTGNLESIALDGRLRRLISAQGESGKQVYGITVSSSRIYWATLRT
ncbi:putative Low-density lipoprotein receptor-related protein 4 [Hypsibius exemplaris]|uniref:Low-density lipoprotein receptor-related protein 4 n=1 Tax=Hypsibius exemplaris TaxID=2072580 RepID=A0A1W0X784_HYPEX|nr:putative Low-density lipoprotein receptor-related protein 4 [Hypsibius exemplaris]